MKKSLSFAMLLAVTMLLAFTGCGNKNIETWMAYDPVDGLAFPSDTSTVVKQWDGGGKAIEIVEHDSTGQWGACLLSKSLFGKKELAWIPLDRMVYGGSDNSSERLETFVVMPETVIMYNHPIGDKKDVAKDELYRNDTVQVTARSYSWVHVRKIHYRKTGKPENSYGWVLESQLRQIDALSYKELDRQAARKTRGIEKFVMTEDYGPLMAKVHPIYHTAAIWLGWAALAMLALLFALAFKRSKIWNLLLLIPAFVLLYIVGEIFVTPTFLMLFFIPVMAYVISYPFLYFKTSLYYGWIFLGLTVVLTGFYMFLYLNIPSSTGFGIVWRVLLLLVMLGVALSESFYLYDRIVADICPYCGYFARHDFGETRHTATSVDYAKRSEKVETGKTVYENQDGSTHHVEHHYATRKYIDRITTEHYETDRTCKHCGQVFVQLSRSSSVERVKKSGKPSHQEYPTDQPS